MADTHAVAHAPRLTSAVAPYQVAVDEAVLDDLRERIADTRWPPEVRDVSWSQGVAVGYLRGLLDYWKRDYSWRRYEAQLNRFEQFTVDIDGQRFHFFHVRSPDPAAVSLLLLHGWPSSAGEFVKVFGPLSDPGSYPDGAAPAFHVVAPDLAGYAFSGPTREPGWGPRRMAYAFAALMGALGYDRFGVQGGDMGSAVAMNLADACPDRVVGMHLNYVPDMRSKKDFIAMRLPDGISWESLTPTERLGMATDALWRKGSMGWHEMKAKEPQNLGYLMEGSPAGLAVAMLPNDEIRCLSHELAFTRDGVLDAITTVWVTGTATSSARMYYELNSAPRDNIPRAYIGVPTGIALFPRDTNRTPRRWVERRYNLTHWSPQPRGGHFAAYDAPDLFTADVRRFFGSLQQAG